MTELLEPNLCQLLINDAEVFALVGFRVFAQMIPQKVDQGDPRVPCLVVTRIGATRQGRHCDSTDPLLAATYQVDSYATDYETAVRAAHAARLALVGFDGDAGAVRIQNVFLDTDFDVGPDPDPGLYRRSLSFSVWYYE